MTFEFRKNTLPLVFIVLVVVVLAVYTLADELQLLRNSSTQTARISSCLVNFFDIGEQGVGDVDQQFAARAELEFGQAVIGAFIHPSQKLCEKRLFREVDVLVHDTDPTLSRMNTFFDFWLVPFLFALVIVVLVLQTLRECTSGNAFRYAVYGALGLACLTVLAHYLKDYETAREFELMGLENAVREKSETGDTDR